MDQIKIGNFISKCRKEKHLTQEQLAEKLNVSSKSISRWENGRTMPDYSLLSDLCLELDININELFSGTRIKESDYMNKAEENFVMLKKKVDSTLNLLKILRYISTVILVLGFFINMYLNWIYQGPWDNTNLKLVAHMILGIDIICILIFEMFNYKINNS